MSSEHSPITHTHAESLMPAFIHGKLDSALQRRMQEHIASCESCATRHREDLELSAAIALTPPAIDQLLTHSARLRNRAHIQALIGSSEPPVQDTAGIGATEGAAKRPRLHLMTAGFTAAAAAVLVAVLLPRTAPPEPTSLPLSYYTRTSPGATPNDYQGSTFKVVFRAEATAESIQRLLLQFDAEIVSGPTAAGVYTLAFPGRVGSGTETLSSLRGQPEVILAEPSVHRDG